MADKIQLEVVTPERRVLAETVDMVTVPGLGGELGILPGHTPLISQLQTGVLTYTCHPFIIGRGHRIMMLERLIQTMGESEFTAEFDAGAAFAASAGVTAPWESACGGSTQ